jgi:hypothetical protein
MITGNLVLVRSGNGTAPAADLERERLVAARAGLVVHQAESLNCETPLAGLGGDVTPTARFYRRSHFPIRCSTRRRGGSASAAWRIGR